MNEYPRDEFDDVSEHTRREGAHRSFVQLRDPRTGLWALIVCGVLALIVGLLMFTVVKPWATSTLSTTGETSSASSATGSSKASASSTAASSEAASTAAQSTDASTPASTTEAESQAPTTTAPSTTAPSTTAPSTTAAAADLATSVGVYNGTSTTGLAQRFASTLTSAGYSTLRTGNWTRKEASSTVYYKTAADRATAEDVASRLGISSVMQVANIPRSVSVVLGADQLTR
ncbi:MAG: LytR C-terminal domain-containing protein [Arthrobacter sp.]|jgi:cytoskeletal protein RodZ|nr:LytR C-terminal domain-containing protein [Arthrobacter sp.]